MRHIDWLKANNSMSQDFPPGVRAKAESVVRKNIAPTHQAAIDRLQKEKQVKRRDTAGSEMRAMLALVEKGVAQEVFQPYGYSFFELT